MRIFRMFSCVSGIFTFSKRLTRWVVVRSSSRPGGDLFPARGSPGRASSTGLEPVHGRVDPERHGEQVVVARGRNRRLRKRGSRRRRYCRGSCGSRATESSGRPSVRGLPPPRRRPRSRRGISGQEDLARRVAVRGASASTDADLHLQLLLFELQAWAGSAGTS